MKILKCHVSSFGKLKEYTVEFNAGLNTIKQENGWGKSTLASFIKAVFYGLSDSKRNVAENERIRFRPWNSTERFGGYIEFEWGKNSYKIERFFGAKESEDTVRLFDLNSGKEYSSTENLGKRIFEIDEEGFLSTTYFSQKDFQIKSNSSITAKFNAVCEIEDSDVFDKALAKIEEKAKTYKYRGDKGLISDARRELMDVNERLQSANKTSMTVASLKDSANLLEKQTEDLKLLSNKLADEVAKAGMAEALNVKREQLTKLQSQRNDLIEQKRQHEKVLNGNLPDERGVSACIECNNELVNVTVREKDIRADLELLSKDGKSAKKFKKWHAVLLGSLALLSAVFGTVFLAVIKNFIVGIAFVSVAIILGFFIIFLGLRTTKGGKNSAFNELLLKKRAELDEYEKISVQYREKINSFIKKFNVLGATDIQDALCVIKNATVEYVRIVREISRIDVEISGFDKNILSVGVAENSDLAMLKSKLASTQREYSLKTNELASKRASVKYYEDIISAVPDLESKKAELTEKIAQYKEDYELYNLTSDFLKKADENLKVKYRAPLQDSLNKYLSCVTGFESRAKIDVDLNVTIEENGAEIVTDYYSKGYRNLFEICKRFALTDVLFTGEKPFIILDDPFYNLDDEKIVQSLKLLSKLSEEYQIIYMVCHESRRPV